tara:strand:- start:3797 stop:4681 length:885 start_codon:yes stop_codon:yes gene_type:complete
MFAHRPAAVQSLLKPSDEGMIQERVTRAQVMTGLGDGFDLPQMSEREMFEKLLSEDTQRDSNESKIASAIGEQMLIMDLHQIPRSVRVRIRDIVGRLSPKNVVIVGGGIGHLTAWLMDLWCGDPAIPDDVVIERPETVRIIEEGGKFGVIIDRLLRRYDASSWAQVITNSWTEVFAENLSWNAASTTLPDSVRTLPLPQPIDLIIIDLPDSNRVEAAIQAFPLLSPGGVMITLEPQVPTGDVGVPESGREPTSAQVLVASFNRWIEFVRETNTNHSAALVELTGGTLAVFRRSA